MQELDLDEMLKREDVAVSRVSEEMKEKAAAYLADILDPPTIALLAQWMGDFGTDWPHRGRIGWHFYGGMQIRNVLREGGFGEEEIGIENLDYIYARLVERAVLGEELDRE
jgi:hypothetical protein